MVVLTSIISISPKEHPPQPTRKLTNDLEHLQPLLPRHAIIRQRLLLQRHLLGLHNLGQRREPRLIEPQIRRNHHRQLGAHRLRPAINLLRDADRVPLPKLNLARLCRLRPPQQAREHLARLVGIVVDALLAEDHQVAPLLLDDRLEQLGDAQRLEVLALLELDVDGAVGAARERRAQNLLRLGRAGAEGADLGDAAGRAPAELLLADERGFLDREVVERVYAVLDAGGLDARLGLVDADFDLLGGEGGLRSASCLRFWVMWPIGQPRRSRCSCRIRTA